MSMAFCVRSDWYACECFALSQTEYWSPIVFVKWQSLQPAMPTVRGLASGSCCPWEESISAAARRLATTQAVASVIDRAKEPREGAELKLPACLTIGLFYRPMKFDSAEKSGFAVMPNERFWRHGASAPLVSASHFFGRLEILKQVQNDT
jgi:hypothetical protein